MKYTILIDGLHPNHSGLCFWWNWSHVPWFLVIYNDEKFHLASCSPLSGVPSNFRTTSKPPAALPLRHSLCFNFFAVGCPCICPGQGLAIPQLEVASTASIARVKNRWWRVLDAEPHKVFYIKLQNNEGSLVIIKVRESSSNYYSESVNQVFSGLADHCSNTSPSPLPDRAPSSWLLWMTSCRFGLKGSSTVGYVPKLIPWPLLKKFNYFPV